MKSELVLSKHYIACLFLLICLCISCSSDNETDETTDSVKKVDASEDPVLSQPGYEGWQKYLDEYIAVYCQPDSVIIARVPAISAKIKQVIYENATRLGVQVPVPLRFVLYDNSMEIKQRTNCTYTCVDGNIIHYMILTPVGEPIMIRLLQDFDPDGTPSKLVYEGLIRYLDYSGQNYVEQAYVDLYNNELTPLDELVNNETYMALDSAARNYQAASFIKFLLAPPYHPSKVLSVYKSENNVVETLESEYNLSLKELEQGWHDYLTQNSELNMEKYNVEG